MKKRYIALIVAVIALLSFTVGAMSKGLVEKIEAELRGDFTVMIDGERAVFRDVNGNVVDPILYNGTTYLPIRAISEIMGKKVYWYQDEKRIELVDETAEAPLVTDADVIVDAAQKPERPKNDIPVADGAVGEITLEEAKEIALEKAGLKATDVVFEEARRDYDDGRRVYDIEFRHGWVEYSFEIDAADGRIIEWERDND